MEAVLHGQLAVNIRRIHDRVVFSVLGTLHCGILEIERVIDCKAIYYKHF